MKKRFFNRLILLIFTILLTIGITACSGDPSENDSGSKTATVSMSILYPKDSAKKSIENYSMNVSEEATVLQVLEAYCEQEGLKITSEEMSGEPYITGIDGVIAKGNMAWIYEVNGEEVMKMASQLKIKNGDKIVWKYTSY